MRTIFKKYPFHLLLIMIAVSWILIFESLTQSYLQTIITPDAISYQESAVKLYSWHEGDQYRPLGMAAITGIPYIFGSSDEGIFEFSNILNFFCFLGTVLLIFEIMTQFLKPKIAFIFVLPCVFAIGINALVFELATENIYMFLVVCVFYFLLKYYKTEAFKFLCFALTLLVLGMLIKPGSKFLAIIVTLVFVKEIIFNYASRYAWLIYVSYFAVFIQCAGLKYQFGRFTISYIDAVTYYDYLGAKAESLRLDVPFKKVWRQRADFIYNRPDFDQKEIARDDLIHQLQNNTGNFFKAYLLNLKENATTGSVNIRLLENIKQSNHFINVKRLVFSVSEIQNAIFSIIGFLLAISFWLKRSEFDKAFLFPAFFIAYIMLLSGVSCSEGDRFHVITFPFIIVLLAQFTATKTKCFSKD